MGKPGCERPLCTTCLVLCWLVIFLGLLMTHASLMTLVPAIVDLPDNLIKGFGEVFKFDYLATDSVIVQNSAAAAIDQCGKNASLFCPSSNMMSNLPPPGNVQDTSAHKTAITGAFSNSLATIKVVSNDQYLGTAQMQNTADQLNNITVELDQISGSMECMASVVIYCGIYDSASLLADGVAVVNAEIDKFRNGDAIKSFESYADWINMIHVLPWVMVISLSFYCCFWWFGRGVCCCCKGGSCAKTMILVPHMLLCLLFFVVTFIFVIIGLVWKTVVMSEKLTMLKGEPTIEEFIDHLQTAFPQFWDTVFADLEKGLASFWMACVIMFVGVIITVNYEICTCLGKPYAKPKETLVYVVK